MRVITLWVVDTSGDHLYYLFTDHLGSTSEVRRAENGTLHSRQYYRAFGEERLLTPPNPDLPTDRTYTGQREIENGLVHYGARAYDPVLARWIQPDSIIPESSQGIQAWDRYAYVNNSPIKYTDETGHCVDGLTTILCVAMGVGAIAGGVYSAVTQYNSTGQVNIDQVIGAALGGAVVAGGAVLVGAAAVIGITTISTIGAAACGDGDCSNEVKTGASGIDKYVGTIFRNASGTADSLTPRLGVDDVPGGGLSFFRGLEYLQPGKYVAVDPNKLNSLTAILDDAPPGHVIVAPETYAQLQEWAATRGTGITHPLTQEVINAVIEFGKR